MTDHDLPRAAPSFEVEADLVRFISSTAWEDPGPAMRAGGAERAFSDLAIRSFHIQCDSIPEYGAYARHVGPRAVRDWREIPPVPASAFKDDRLSAARGGNPEAHARAVADAVTFETSGTTISRPGLVRLQSTRLYEASLLTSFARHLLPDGARLKILIFGPTRAESPRSSLWFMAERVAARFCDEPSWIVEQGEPRWEQADAELARSCEQRRPVLLLGTTLLFNAYMERCDRRGLRFALPAGSRAMDTGGAKGTRVELRRDDIAASFHRVLGIPPSHLVNEYGMAELGSQFYEDTLLSTHEGRAPRPGLAIPPWVRTRVLDPESMRELPEGKVGLLVHYDLANLDVPLAIQTEDLGARIDGRLVLEGRLPDAERRGCSLPFEQFVERERVRQP